MGEYKAKLKHFWAELRRRKTVRSALAYLILIAAVAGFANDILDPFDADWISRYLIIGLVACFPVVLVLSWIFDFSLQGIERTGDADDSDSDQDRRTRRHHDISADHISIAILSFTVSSKPETDEDKSLAVGIASEISTLLTPIQDIRVSSRATIFDWSSSDAGKKKAADQLNADFVLTGSLYRSGDNIRVSAELSEMNSDSIIWTKTYDREIEDLFAVQKSIAESIVGTTLGQVRLAESKLATHTPMHQLDSWGLMQRAYYFWLYNFTPENIAKAIEYLQQAIRLDPEYAAPRAGLAMLLGNLITSRYAPDPDAAKAEAEKMASEAYRLAPNDVEVLEGVGVSWMNLGKGHESERVLRHALELAPLNLICRGYLALTLGFKAETESATEAKAIVEENFRIAPEHPSAAWWSYFLTVAEQSLQNYEASIESGLKAISGQPHFVHTYYFLANAYILLGDRETANEYLEKAIAINPGYDADFFMETIDLVSRGSPGAINLYRGIKLLQEETKSSG